MIEKSRSELGDFLRSRRAKLRPEDVGLANGRRRRTAGLRREEVAELAGIGVDWYIRLEQGRSVNPSATTIDALARALRLSKVEHSHFRALTRSQKQAFKRETVPATLRRLVDAMVLPAYVTGRRWDVLAWNAGADDLFGFDRMREEDRNTLLMILARPGARRLLRGSWADEAKRMIGQFRPVFDLWADDPEFRALHRRLSGECPEFAEWWKAHDVRGAGAGVKRIHHPRKGLLRFEHASFQSTEDPTLRLIVYTPL